MLLQLFTLSVIVAGCYKDTGNYDYRKINDVSIGISADSMQVLLYDTLRITPAITAADTSRLRYEWRVYPVGDPADPLGIGKIVVLSRSRNLKEQITLKPQQYYYSLDLVAIDTITGVSYFKNLKLQVRTAFQTGWMLLEQKSSGGDISFIGPDNQVYHSVYSATNPDKPLPPTVSKLISVNTQGLLGTVNLVSFTNGGYVLDNTTLAVTTNYANLFYSPPVSAQPSGLVGKPSIFAYGPFTFAGGKVYGMNSLFTSVLFGAPYTQPDASGYEVAPYAAGGQGYGNIFFDQLHHRFLYDGGGTSTALKAFPANTSMAFDLNNVPKTMLTMKAGMGWDLWPDNWYAVFKNPSDNNCFLYTINANGNMTDLPVASAQQAILNSPEVQRSPDYLFSATIRQMYYAADNKLYVYDMAANQSRVIYTFASGENITALQMSNNVITLATYNGTPGGGTVYYLPIASTGDIAGNTYTQKFTGFEKIVHLVAKAG